MEHIRIIAPGDPGFDWLYDLYMQSFPVHEQRLRERQEGVLGHPEYHCDLLCQGETRVGLLMWWAGPLGSKAHSSHSRASFSGAEMVKIRFPGVSGSPFSSNSTPKAFRNSPGSRWAKAGDSVTIFTSDRENRLQYSNTPQASAWAQHFRPSFPRHSSAFTSPAKDINDHLPNRRPKGARTAEPKGPIG